jgi:hypothetical protein
MYWSINKITNDPGIFGSLKKLSEHHKINIHTLYNHFSRQKLKEFENESVRIVKVEKA